jgi:hypothetical protein
VSEDLKLGLLLILGVFGLVVVGGGAAVLYGHLQYMGTHARQKILAYQEANPDSPWSWRQDWAKGRIRDSEVGAHKRHWFSWVLGAGACVIYALDHDLDHLVNAIQGVVALGLVAFALVRWRKFGVSQFLMDQTPGRFGTELRGQVLLPKKVDDLSRARVTLSCEERGLSNSVSTLWKSETVPGVVTSGEGSTGNEIHLVVLIPPGDLPNSGPRPEPEISTIRWMLRVHAACKGVEFKCAYEVPVYRVKLK